MYFGPEATEFTASRALNQQVTILIDTASDERDRYGRLLAYVRLPDGTILNEELVRCGFGYAYLTYPHSHFEDYRQLMDQAMQEERGLWKEVKRDQLPKWLQQKRPELLR
ncbi:MAG: thermonuclease family protein [Planctomycetaceae bacterium]|nr:thermonuclease family protein [Planctomycetaceae bacterium]